MKTFFEDLGKKLGETAEQVTSIAGDAVEIQKLKGQIRNLERGNDNDLEDLGRAVYQQYLDGERVDEKTQELCDTIKAREDSIAECISKIIKIKGDNICPVCGKHIAKDMAFCPYCGTKMPEEEETEFNEEYAADAAEDAAEDADDTAEDADDTVKDVAADIAEAAKETASQAVEAAKAVAGEAVDFAKEAADKAADFFTKE